MFKNIFFKFQNDKIIILTHRLVILTSITFGVPPKGRFMVVCEESVFCLVHVAEMLFCNFLWQYCLRQ